MGVAARAGIQGFSLRRICRLCCLSLLCAGAAQGGSRLAGPELSAAPLQSYPGHPAPSQPSVPGSAPERPAPTPTRTEQFTLSQDRYEKAIAYSRAEYTLYFLSSFLVIATLILILRFGLAARFRDLAQRFTDRWWLQALIFVPLLILATDLAELPIRLYWHSLSLRYEQSVERWGSWLLDLGKEELLGIAFALILSILLFAVMRWKPQRWWLYFWFAALPILLFIFYVSPWFIDPLFNKFEPLNATHPELVESMERVLQRAGLIIPRERMFLMRASDKTNDINAYVTGFGASKRVVVWDTTIQKLTTNETLFIFGHEAGHYVLGHVRNGFLFFAGVLLMALYLGFRGLRWILEHWGGQWKIYGPNDWAALAVLLLLLQAMMFLSSPLTNAFSRMQEHAADVYGLEVIHGLVPNSDEVAAHAFQVLGEIDLADPNPPELIRLWLYSHPPLADRLIFAHSYDPWSKGESPKYVKIASK